MAMKLHENVKYILRISFFNLLAFGFNRNGFWDRNVTRAFNSTFRLHILRLKFFGGRVPSRPRLKLLSSGLGLTFGLMHFWDNLLGSLRRELLGWPATTGRFDRLIPCHCFGIYRL